MNNKKYCDHNFKEDISEFKELNIEDNKLNENEESYRRGYAQGFAAARRNENLTQEEVNKWRHSNLCTAPPGSGLEGIELSGLTKNETIS